MKDSYVFKPETPEIKGEEQFLTPKANPTQEVGKSSSDAQSNAYSIAKDREVDIQVDEAENTATASLTADSP